ncbi:MAG TPA: WG repeat-containing protein [Flavobacteriales bacterium]|nr:WG repeat-containing protein [Flavobacteriales bacterium]
MLLTTPFQNSNNTALTLMKSSSGYGPSAVVERIADIVLLICNLLANVILSQAKNLDNFYEGRAGALKKGKWGYVDKTGQFVIEPICEHARGFRDGKAWAMDGECQFYILLDI